MPAPRRVIGIDLGGTGSRFVLMGEDGKVLKNLTVKTPTFSNKDLSIQFIMEAINSVANGTEIFGVGIGATGPIDPDGIIQNPDTLAAFSGCNLVDTLANELSLPVYIENDAVSAALAEYQFGSTRKSSSLLLITLGTGIGTSLLINGEPFRGGDGWHPEGGHLDVGRLNEGCYCGRTSCWESSASRQALQRIAAEKINFPVTSIADLDEIVARTFTQDPVAIEIFKEYGIRVAEGLANLCGLYRPTDIVFSGGGARYFAQFSPAMLNYLEKVQNWIPKVIIQASILGDFAGAMGAATLAL